MRVCVCARAGIVSALHTMCNNYLCIKLNKYDALDYWTTGPLDHWTTGPLHGIDLDYWTTGLLDYWTTGLLDRCPACKVIQLFGYTVLVGYTVPTPTSALNARPVSVLERPT
jgi:hypothetical protein